MKRPLVTIDGNEAAAFVAHKINEVIAIYPITPSSTMGEWSDQWSSEGKKNIWGTIPTVTEMQSEGGASGAVHGALQTGALTTTFTASQGLLLMIPNMFKIAGELTPTVFHVSARSVAAQALSIFGDHSDVMAVRSTGFGLLASNSIQEIMDFALISQAVSLKAKIPFIHFFDGFRSSSEVQKIEQLLEDDMRAMIDDELVFEHRKRALTPDNPVLRGTAQNPDVFFQGREANNKYYDAAPEIVQEYMDKLAKVIGRQYHLFDYVGAPDAEKLIIAMGSGVETIEETINYLNAKGEKLGLLKVRLFRPFSVNAFIDAIPETVKKIVVLDRTKEPGAIGDPLYLDTVAALKDRKDLTIIGGRYGLSSKEFTPSMVKAVYDHLDGEATHGFTVGINDDVTNKSLKIGAQLNTMPEGGISCKFWGLGSDGTVGANKNSIKIIGDNTDMYAQGYFQYDSKKSGGITRSHLRFGKSPIQSEYLVENANFIGCHNPAFIGRYDILEGIKNGGIFLLNSHWKTEEVFENLTEDMQNTIINKKIKLYNINALKIANDVGLGSRINTVMQTAFFLISGVLKREEAINMIKKAIEKTFIKKGKNIVEMNWTAVDKTNEALVEISVPDAVPANHTKLKKLVPDDADEFTKNIIEKIMREKGDDIPVSHMPLDGFVPSGTTKLEKRGVSPIVPHWDADLCIQCNQCSIVCPHAAIRPKLIKNEDMKGAPESFNTLTAMGKDKDDFQYKIQVYIEDCQGCMVCVNECPKQALAMKPIEGEREAGEKANVDFFESLPNDVMGSNIETTVKGSQFKQPLMEFSGACAGCGETPYVKLITQLFGNRMIIANATGCTSIWGGTFPNIPYCKNKDGHGPTWANSLFEDNAEYSFGMRLSVDANRKQLRYNVEKLLTNGTDAKLETVLRKALELWNAKDNEAVQNSIQIQSFLQESLKKASGENEEIISKIVALKNHFVDKSVWAFGGDGWAYDIGYGGVDLG